MTDTVHPINTIITEALNDHAYPSGTRAAVLDFVLSTHVDGDHIPK